jgi:hypothetical protein
MAKTKEQYQDIALRQFARDARMTDSRPVFVPSAAPANVNRALQAKMARRINSMMK